MCVRETERARDLVDDGWKGVVLKQDRLARGQMREREERQKQIDRKQVGRMMFASARTQQQRKWEKYSDSDGSSGSPCRKSNKNFAGLWQIKLHLHTFSTSS